MKLSEILKQCHDSGDFGEALEGLPEQAARLESELDAVWERIEEVKRVYESGYTDREMEDAVRNL